MDENGDRAQRLHACLELIAAGEPVESALAALGDDTDLVATALLGARLGAVVTRQPRPSFRAALQVRLQTDGTSVARPGRTARRRWVARLGGALAAVALALGTVVVASADSLPGGALYGVKLATERAQLAIADGAGERALLHLTIAHRRLSELQQLLERGRDMPPSLIEAWAKAHAEARISAAESGDPEVGRRADEALAADRAELGALMDAVGDDMRRALEPYLGEPAAEHPGSAPPAPDGAPVPMATTAGAAEGVPVSAPSATRSVLAATAEAAATATAPSRSRPNVAAPLPPPVEGATQRASEPDPTSAPPVEDSAPSAEPTARPMGTAAARQTERVVELTSEPPPTATPVSRWPWPWPRWPSPEPTQSVGPGSAPSPAAPTTGPFEP